MDIPLHFFNRDDESSVPFKIESLRLQTDYNTGEPHRHNYYEIFFFEEGGGYHTIDFNRIPIKSHSLHFVSPGQVHLIERSPESHGDVILFSRDFYYLGLQEKQLLFEMPFLNNAVESPILNLDPELYQECHEILQRMKREFNGGEYYSNETIRSYLNILMIRCSRIFSKNSRQEVGSRSESTLSSRFRKLLEENYMKYHQVKDYVALLGGNDRQLNDAVKTVTGKGVLDHIHSRLLLEARRLLMHSDLSAKEVAYLLGFEDPSHFNRFFKAKVGCTPGEFRSKVGIYH